MEGEAGETCRQGGRQVAGRVGGREGGSKSGRQKCSSVIG